MQYQNNIQEILNSKNLNLKIPSYKVHFVVGLEGVKSSKTLELKNKEIVRQLKHIIKKDEGVVLSINQIAIKNYYLSELYNSSSTITELEVITSNSLLKEINYYIKNNKDIVHYTIIK